MPLASYILSLCLHVAGILLLWLWPVGDPLINLEQPVLISLVEGDPGGNKTPSPILGHMGEPGQGEPAPTPPAQRAEVAASAREETMVAPDPAPAEDRPMMKEEPRKPEIQPVPKPMPEPKEEAVIPKKQEKKPE
ncbi:MAG: protein TolA, partial [Desulfovibrionaceae bacterium]|nr:protein TolA [Desulfovibrionaceae bacterium]